MMTEGCGDDGKAKCHASDAEADLNAGKLAKLEKEVGDRKSECVNDLRHENREFSHSNRETVCRGNSGNH